MKLNSILIAFVALAAASMALAFGWRSPNADIVDTAVGSKQFPTLVAAVQAAGLVEALKSEGPFTVFAPTEAAFKAFEAKKPGTLASLLKPENKEKLAAILKFHVVSGKVLAADVMKLKNGTHVKSLLGQSIRVRNKNGVHINQAKVVKTDIMASNGVIHVIDAVLLPK